MKNFIFVSDFDGTLTKRDFYHLAIENCLGEEGKKIYVKWKNNELKDIEFLDTVFRAMDKDETEIYRLIDQIVFDSKAASFIKRIKNAGGEFLVLSAGVTYYIEKVLQAHKLADIQIIANKGKYEDRGIRISPDVEGPFYSELYGVDKSLVVQSLRSQYKTIFYAGDGIPDYKASLAADFVFAKGELAELLKKSNREFLQVRDFGDIADYLVDHGILAGDK